MTSTDDPFLWLEEIESDRALEWVRQQNAITLERLQADPDFETLHPQALTILQAPDRLPLPDFYQGDELANFWQDETHVRGISRRTTLDSYRTATPEWEIILDVDALAEAEGANWVFKGSSALATDPDICTIYLSDGGEDAVELREFNRRTKQFVEDGFNSPKAKQSIAWIDRDTVLICRDWGKGTLTKSGYPYIVKRWTRGQALDQAQEVFRGQPSDMGVWPFVMRRSDRSIAMVGVSRSPSFFESERYVFSTSGVQLLPFPKRAGVHGLLKDQLVFTLDADWPEQGLKSGDVASCDFSILQDRNEVSSRLIFRPNSRQSVSGVTITRDYLLLGLLDNVQGQVRLAKFADGEWQLNKLKLPENSTIEVFSASDEHNMVMIAVTNLLTPTSILLADLDTGSIETLKTGPARFDASTHVTEQFQAISADGTSIPYFVVRPKDMAFDGQAPTLLYAYGGFQVSMEPSYLGLVGKQWLERGGIYVLANIRGGGEFGPAWHEAGRKENRQRVFDDFHAVAEDLIRRGITSPGKLGIRGGSNGGLLMGVAMTQRPDLYGAVIIGVPLLDMLRYTVMGGAGASWVGEYGDPAIPEERAWIEAYSPYQAVEAGEAYPEALILTSTKDDRVHPGHARKMAAKLQSLGYPVLYYENIEGGHGGAANLKQSALQSALEYTYLLQKLSKAKIK
jgi:prolyl oligopeptidase